MLLQVTLHMKESHPTIETVEVKFIQRGKVKAVVQVAYGGQRSKVHLDVEIEEPMRVEARTSTLVWTGCAPAWFVARPQVKKPNSMELQPGAPIPEELNFGDVVVIAHTDILPDMQPSAPDLALMLGLAAEEEQVLTERLPDEALTLAVTGNVTTITLILNSPDEILDWILNDESVPGWNYKGDPKEHMPYLVIQYDRAAGDYLP